MKHYLNGLGLALIAAGIGIGCSCGYRSQIGAVDGGEDAAVIDTGLIDTGLIDRYEGAVPLDCPTEPVVSANDGPGFLGWIWNGDRCAPLLGTTAIGQTEFIYASLHGCEVAYQRCSESYWTLVPVDYGQCDSCTPGADDITILGASCRVGDGMTASIELSVAYDVCRRPGPITYQYLPVDESMPDVVQLQIYRWHLVGPATCPPPEAAMRAELSVPIAIRPGQTAALGPIQIQIARMTVNNGSFRIVRSDPTAFSIGLDDNFPSMNISDASVGERCSSDTQCRSGLRCMVPYNIGAVECQDEGRCFHPHEVAGTNWGPQTLYRNVEAQWCPESGRVNERALVGGAIYQNVCFSTPTQPYFDCSWPGVPNGEDVRCALASDYAPSSNSLCNFDRDCPRSQSCIESIDGVERRCADRIETSQQECSPRSFGEWGPVDAHSVGNGHIIPWTCQFIGE